MKNNREKIDNTVIKQPPMALPRGFLPGYFGKYAVENGWVAVITERGAYRETLGPGEPFLWRLHYSPDLRATKVSQRIHTLAIMTNDEFRIQQDSARHRPVVIDLALSLSIEYRVTDPRLVAMEIEQPVTALFDRVVLAARHALSLLTISEVFTSEGATSRTIRQVLAEMQLPETIGIEVLSVFVTSLQLADSGPDALNEATWLYSQMSNNWERSSHMAQDSKVTWEWLVINRPELAQRYIARYGDLAKDLVERGVLHSGYLIGEDASYRLDAAIPDSVAVGTPFDMAVAVRMNNSPQLRIDILTHVNTGTIEVEWPADQNAVDLRAVVHAPECQFNGPSYQLFRLHVGKDSPIVYFSLIPLRTGDIPVRVTIYQSLLALGTTRLTAEVTERLAGAVEMVVRSGDLRLLTTVEEEHLAARELQTLLVRAFSMEELESLCFEMNIDADNLTGTTRQRKATALVDYCRRHRRVDELIDRVIEKRPNWLELLGEL